MGYYFCSNINDVYLGHKPFTCMSELALKLIAENKAAHQRGEDATSLDLGRCGLSELPEELFECIWLEKLIVSNTYWDWQERKWVESNNKGSKNTITTIPSGITTLQSLKVLKISGDDKNRWKISDGQFLEM